MDIVSRVKNIIAQQLDVSIDKISADSNFIEDLGADSLAVVEIVLAFEGEFGIDIPDEVTKDMQTVGDVIAYVQQKQAA
jgi:acyl carrier protein